MKYKFRNLTCTIQPDEKLWCVSGCYDKGGGNRGGGILEWCYDRNDAEYILGEMSKDHAFFGLKAEKYIP